MKLVDAILIKNTSKQERESNVKKAFNLGTIESFPPSTRLKELAQTYVDGKMEIQEIYQIRKKELLHEYSKGNKADIRDTEVLNKYESELTKIAMLKTAGYRKKYLNNKVLKFAPLKFDVSSVKYNPLSEIAFRTPEEIGDVMNIYNMIVDPDGKGLEDHWAKTGQALVGVVIHLLYVHEREERKPPTLSDVATFLSSPDRDYTEQIHSMKVYPHITVEEALSENNILQKIYGEYIRDIRSYAKDGEGKYFYQWTDKSKSWLPEWDGEHVVFSLDNLKADIRYRIAHGEDIDWKSEFTGKDRSGNMHYNYAALLTHPKAVEAAAEMEKNDLKSCIHIFLMIYMNGLGRNV